MPKVVIHQKVVKRRPRTGESNSPPQNDGDARNEPSPTMEHFVEHRRGGAVDLDPITIIVGLYGLWVARVISEDAFFLGAQVCQMMHAQGSRQVILQGQVAQNRIVTLDGALYAGPLTKNITTYAEALQHLHFRGGLINNIVEPRDTPGELINHFTLNQKMLEGIHYDFTTPIYFRMFPISKREYLQKANIQAAQSLGNCPRLEIRD